MKSLVTGKRKTSLPILKKGGKERSGDLWTSQPQLCAQEDLGIDPSQGCTEACKKQTADQTAVCAHSPEIKLLKCVKRGVASRWREVILPLSCLYETPPAVLHPWSPEQAGPVKGVLVHSILVATGWSLRTLSAQAVLRCYDSNFLWFYDFMILWFFENHQCSC